MCVNCGSDGIGRRDFIKFGAAAAIALGPAARRRGARGGSRADCALSRGSARRAQIGQ